MTRLIGTNAFLAACGGISTTLSRKLERLGIVRPQRTDGGRGHRAFSERDVRAARAWIAKHGRRTAQ